MPPSVSRSGAFSPPLSSAASFSTNSQSRLNVVTRLALEGKAKQSSEGASVMLYMKMTVPLDSVNPGQLVPLFAEENVKIRGFQVHPLDSDNAPYNFSSTTNPDLHNAARALNLPPRSSRSYLSLFDSAAHLNANHNRPAVQAMEERYSGSFLISGYNVCYVLPKEFPASHKLRAGTDSDGDGLSSQNNSRRSISRARRRNSLSERSVIQFMAALSLWIPFASKPPRCPYMLSIPLPRCLSNHIRLRLPPPASVQASFASLDSENEDPGWDLATEPQVIRGPRQSMSTAYSAYADDESSDASTSAALENCLIQGTFTSTDVLRIRWASPLSVSGFPTQPDGRRRANVDEVRGNVTCTVLETIEDTVKMRLDYTATISGIFFPGVASLLALDLALDAQGARAFWAPGCLGWKIAGDAGYTGTLVQPQNSASSRNSFEVPAPNDSIASFANEMTPNGKTMNAPADSSSLLRAPLPNRKISNEFSFEGSVHSITSSAIRSPGSSENTPSIYRTGQMQTDDTPLPPTTPITLQINMNELVRSKLSISISGVLLVSLADEDAQETTFPIPKFRLLGAGNERVSTTVRNQFEGANVELLEDSMSSRSSSSMITGLDASNVKRTVIPNGSQAKTTSLEGSEIVIKPATALRSPEKAGSLLSSGSRRKQMRSPTGLESRANSPEKGAGLRVANISIQQHEAPIPASRSAVLRDGPLVIPWATAEVVPINAFSSKKQYSYAVSVSLPTPVDAPSEWLEFGLAMKHPEAKLQETPSLPLVRVSCASVNGVPVRFETFSSDRGNSIANLNSSPKSEGNEKVQFRWLSWVRVRVSLVGALEVTYVVTGDLPSGLGMTQTDQRNKGKAGVPTLIPVFTLPVSRYEICIRRASDTSTQTSPEMERKKGDPTLHRKLYAFDINDFALPYSDITIPSHLFLQGREASPPDPRQILGRSAKRAFFIVAGLLPYAFSGALVLHSVGMRKELRDLRNFVQTSWNEPAHEKMEMGSARGLEIVTVTNTIIMTTTAKPSLVSTSERGWFGDTFTVSYSVPTSKTQQKSSAPTPSFEPVKDEYPEEDEGYDPYYREYDDDSAEKRGTSLLPILYLPLTWPAHIHYSQAKAQLLSGWGRFWHVVEIVLHWPLPVDE